MSCLPSSPLSPIFGSLFALALPLFLTYPGMLGCLFSQASIAEARAQSAPLQLTTTNPTAQELGNSTQQKLRVCDICGALLSIFDSNDRLAEQ